MADFDQIAALESFFKLPRTQRIGALGLAYVVVLGIFWTMVYSPKVEEVASLDSSSIELQQNLDRQRIRAANREDSEAQLEGLTESLGQALQELPLDREISELLNRISQVGKNVGLEVRKFQPLPDVMHEYYAEVPVAIEVEGSFHEVAMFFDRISQLGRIVSVRNVDISEPDERNGKMYLTVTGRVVTYRFLSDEERAEVAASSRGRKGKAKGRQRGGGR